MPVAGKSVRGVIIISSQDVGSSFSRSLKIGIYMFPGPCDK